MAALTTCLSKKAFATREAAQRRAREIATRNPGHALAPYKCPLSGHWHVSHARSKRRLSISCGHKITLKRMRRCSALYHASTPLQTPIN
jgi:hypothetical protein